MLNNKRQNYHHSKLPSLGDIVELPGLLRNGLPEDYAGKWIVESFPLTDSPDYHYSYGVHTVNLRRLSDSKKINVSGIWCDVLHWLN